MTTKVSASIDLIIRTRCSAHAAHPSKHTLTSLTSQLPAQWRCAGDDCPCLLPPLTPLPPPKRRTSGGHRDAKLLGSRGLACSSPATGDTRLSRGAPTERVGGERGARRMSVAPTRPLIRCSCLPEREQLACASIRSRALSLVTTHGHQIPLPFGKQKPGGGGGCWGSVT